MQKKNQRKKQDAPAEVVGVGVHAEEAHEGVQLAHAVLQGRAGEAPVGMYLFIYVWVCVHMWVGVNVGACV